VVVPVSATRRSRLAAGSVLAAVALTATACGGSSGADEPAAASAAMGPNQDFSAGSVKAADSVRTSGAAGEGDVQQRAVISTGGVELSTGDVAAIRDRVDSVLAQEGGRIADEDTVTDEEGTVTRAHLVLRVPNGVFDETMTRLAGLATLRSSTRKAQDVTTRVIDVNARIEAQRAGVRRLRDLIGRAANLPALLAVERELTARQGDLESLLQQRAYLADRTSLATVTVDISRHVARSPAKRSTGGFVGGLHHGWHALVAVVVGLLVGVGAGLPFAVVLALLGVPAWLVARRMRRSHEPDAPAET
jgi:hypothetical protein